MAGPWNSQWDQRYVPDEHRAWFSGNQNFVQPSREMQDAYAQQQRGQDAEQRAGQQRYYDQWRQQQDRSLRGPGGEPLQMPGRGPGLSRDANTPRGRTAGGGFGSGVSGGAPQIPARPGMPPPQAPPLPSNASPGYRPPAFNAPGRADNSNVRNALNGIGDVNMPGVGRVGNYSGLPNRSDVVGDWNAGGGPQLGQAPDRGRADQLTDRMAAGMQLDRFGRSQLGGPAGDNVWEQLALDRFEGGFDPGAGQYQGREIRQEVFTPEQVNQMAQQRAASTVRAFQDAQRYAGEAAAAGGYADPARLGALKARAAIEGAGALSGATRDAQLEAAAANAAQEQAWSANARSNFETDLAARLGLGNLGLSEASTLLSGGLQRRGLDQTRDIAGFQGDITQRGQDIQQGLGEAGINADLLRSAAGQETALRGQDMDWGRAAAELGLAGRGQDLTARGQDIGYEVERGQQGLTARGQDITQRAQDLEQQYRQAGLNADQARARAQMELGLYQSGIEETLGLGRLGLEGRQQDIAAGQFNASNQLERDLGLGRLANEQYGIQANMYEAGQQRQQRIDEINAQLQDASLDRQTRAQLQREQYDLQRELSQIQSGQFGQTFGEGQRQFNEQLGENRRQFDERMDLARRESSRGQGGYSPWAPQQSQVNPLMGNWQGGPFGQAGSQYDFQALLDALSRMSRAA